MVVVVGLGQATVGESWCGAARASACRCLSKSTRYLSCSRSLRVVGCAWVAILATQRQVVKM